MDMRKSGFSLLAAALAAVALPAAAAIATISQTQIVEFYNTSLDHYFITADAKEISDLDTGVHPGWARTGLTFQAVKAGATLPGSTPVCRFYGNPAAGLDSHFYSASPTECAVVQEKFSGQWQYESPEVFRAFLVDPNTGKCPSDTGPVYRLYNKRADVNHRYTDQLTVFQTMTAKGYVAEGDGNPQLPVAFCMPASTSSTPASSPPGTPSCSLSAATTTPSVGGIVALTTVCTGSPTSYAWVGCTSSTGTCQATSNAAGTVTYTLTASNSVGAGAPASISLAWQGATGPVPICTLSGTSAQPATGSSLGLVANCSQTPTRYDWLECSYMLQSACNFIPSCSSSSPTCTVVGTNPGFAHYALQAANGAGLGPRVGFDAEWSGSTSTPSAPSAPACTLSASNAFPTVNGSVVLSAACSGNPTSYVWTGCTSSGSSCSTSSAAAGAKTFGVVASNSTGTSAPASTTVTWQSQPVPNCSVSASKSSPIAGIDTITLTASCSGSPTGYQWSGCTPVGAQCTVAEAAAGGKSYNVVASNGAGSGPQAGVTVNWQAAPTSPPACTISASNSSPFTGTSVTLTASCNNSPSSYAWTGCSSASATCVTTSSAAGALNYSVSASNIVGQGAAASTTVSWQQSTAPPDFCSAYSDVVRISKSWGGVPTYPSDYGGAFRASEVLVIAVTVPASAANASSKLFSASVSEYQGAGISRDFRLSRSPCDFSRSLDSTGANGPISIGGRGSTTTVSGNVGFNMQPGDTFYISIRNYFNGSLQCTTSTCNAIVGYQWPL
jgi:hypothetical protein